MTSRPITFVFAICALASCYRKNPDFCEQKADCANGQSCDMELHACVDGCVTDGDCAAPTPFCESATGSCHECGPAGDGSYCASEKPLCGVDLTCRACTNDSQCTQSGICLDDGSCAPLEEVIYVDAAAVTDDPSCSRTMPCAKLETALAAVTASRNLISLAPGTYAPASPLAILTSTRLRGASRASPSLPPAAVIHPAGKGPAIDVHADLTIEDVLLTGTTDTTASSYDAHAVQCHTSGAALVIRRVHVVGNAERGVDDNGCSLTIAQSNIRSNGGGGVAVQGATFSIMNSFFSGNGRGGGVPPPSTTTFGGLSLSGIGNGSEFAFNTVAGNTAFMDDISGVSCDTPSLRATSNIVFGNSAIATQVTLPGACSWDHSIVDVAGIGNQKVDPMLVGISSGDLHLLSSSPAKGAGAIDVPNVTDYDGEARPRPAGGTPDIGADEID